MRPDRGRDDERVMVGQDDGDRAGDFGRLRVRRSVGVVEEIQVDVTDPEPLPPESRLWDLPSVIITPHVAWATLAARRRLMRITAENVAAFLAGQPINLVN